jgi:hypothetical protein
MKPRNAILGIVADDLAAKFRANLTLRDAKALWKVSFDQVAGHGNSQCWLRNSD